MIIYIIYSEIYVILVLFVGPRKFEKSYAILFRKLLCSNMVGEVAGLIGALRYI